MTTFRWLFSIALLASLASVIVRSPGVGPVAHQTAPGRPAPTAAEEAGEPLKTPGTPRSIGRNTVTFERKTERRKTPRSHGRLVELRTTGVRPTRTDDSRGPQRTITQRTGAGLILRSSAPPAQRDFSPVPHPETEPRSVPAPVPAADPSATAVPAPSREAVLTPPVPLGQPSPQYPSEGFRLVLEHGSLTPQLRVEAAQGRVVLRLLVLKDGSVGRVEVAAPSGSAALDQAAVAAARLWRFVPATRDGVPIDAWVVIPVRFVVP